ncbi:hypothetical protein ACPV5X_02195 [Legionella pneumophila]|uniref:hypothetical protein n=1 Tax=Legionella pneumophila TaxID=446 RepID=UPI003CAE6A9A
MIALKSKKEKTDAAESISLLQQVKPVPSTKADDSADFEARDGDIEPDFDPNTIAELLSQKLLFIENDRELMTLTIQCDPDLLSPKQLNEVNKFVQSILNEWNEFKKENPNAGQLTIKKDSSGNIFYFQATLSTQALYDAFMERLANHLVPNADLQDKTQRELGQETTTPTPFSTVPKPTVSKKTKEEERVSVKEKEEEEQKQDQPFNPSPFVLKPNPWKTGE